MKLFKLLTAASLLCLCSLTALAQQYKLTPVSVTGTNLNGANTISNTIAAASAVTFNGLIPFTKYDSVGIQLTAKLMAAGSSAITAMIDISTDGTNWITPAAYISTTANGTTAVTCATNLTSTSFGYARLAYVTNASNVVLTNLAVTYSVKPGRTGN